MAEKLTVEQELQLEAVAEKGAVAETPTSASEATFKPTQLGKPQPTQTSKIDLDTLQKIETEVLKSPPDKVQTVEVNDLEALQQIESGTLNGEFQIPDSKPAPILQAPQFSRILGTPGEDDLTGTGRKDFITGFGGDDTISGKGGNDNISGGGENDFIKGGGGNDLIFGDASASENLFRVGSGNDTIFGNDGNDQLYGQDREDEIYGGRGKDYIEGGNGNDIVVGQQGADILFGDSSEGQPFSTAKGDDQISGGSGDDYLDGGRGEDLLKGQNGNDRLVGGQGNDKLKGGRGKDTLIGTDNVFFAPQESGFGFGERDTLTGGKNSDTFVLGLAEALIRKPDGTDGIVKDIVLYDDGNVVNNGTQDYALITDFGYIGDTVIRGVDRIQLAGSESEYSLGASPIDDFSGTGIFLEEGQNTPELIGIVKGISQDTLSLSDSTQFVFV